MNGINREVGAPKGSASVDLTGASFGHAGERDGREGTDGAGTDGAEATADELANRDIESYLRALLESARPSNNRTNSE